MTALARGDALYAECLGGTRRRLGQALASFRLVLKNQGLAEIAATRAALLDLIEEIQQARPVPC